MQHKTDLSTTVGGLRFNNPVIAASGTAAYGNDMPLLHLDRLGGIVLKTVTPAARQGNPTPRIAETASGMINAIGLENPGIDLLCEKYIPALSEGDYRVIASIYADETDDIASMALKLSQMERVDAVEVNLSCPNLKHGTTVSFEPELVSDFVTAAVSCGRPVWAKVSPVSPDITATVSAATEAGAACAVVANTFPATVIDWRNAQPLIGHGTGGLSGPAVLPLALYNAALVCARTELPVVASGGAFSAEDVLQFLSVGAAAVQVGTAGLVDPTAVCRIPEEIGLLLEEESVSSVSDILGRTDVFGKRR